MPSPFSRIFLSFVIFVQTSLDPSCLRPLHPCIWINDPGPSPYCQLNMLLMTANGFFELWNGNGVNFHALSLFQCFQMYNRPNWACVVQACCTITNVLIHALHRPLMARSHQPMERQFWPSFWTLMDGNNELQEISLHYHAVSHRILWTIPKTHHRTFWWWMHLSSNEMEAI